MSLSRKRESGAERASRQKIAVRGEDDVWRRWSILSLVEHGAEDGEDGGPKTAVVTVGSCLQACTCACTCTLHQHLQPPLVSVHGQKTERPLMRDPSLEPTPSPDWRVCRSLASARPLQTLTTTSSQTQIASCFQPHCQHFFLVAAVARYIPTTISRFRTTAFAPQTTIPTSFRHPGHYLLAGRIFLWQCSCHATWK